MLAVDGASIAPAHKTVISAGRIVIYFEEEKKGGTCERRESEREELHRWPGLRNQLWIQMATYVAAMKHAAFIVFFLFVTHRVLVALLTPAAWVELAAFFSFLTRNFCFPCS